MKKNRKYILSASAICGILLLTAAINFLHVPAASKLTASVFSDIDSSPYQDAISYMQTNGIVSGYSDGTFKPAAEINRAEFTKILVQSAFSKELETSAAQACFTDVKASDWFSKYVCLAKDKGIITGYSDGTFHPGQSINAAEALKISLEAHSGGNIPDATGDWYQKYLNLAYSKGYMLSEWSDVTKKISRGEMSQFIYQILDPQAPAQSIYLGYYDEEIMTPFG